jgi:hypothetical protein
MTQGPVRAAPEADEVFLPDPVATHAGVVSESEHEALRADIRRLSTMLGQTVAHQAGDELLELTETVRRLARTAADTDGATDAEITRLLSGLDAATAVALARVFSQYFQLANIAEQLHRARELRILRPAEGGPLRAVMRRLAAEADHDAVQDVLARAELQPVFTAHPTEASRQSVLRILRRIAELLARDASDDELGAMVDALWQTDEIRPGPPTVADEARAIGWYLEQLGGKAVPELVAEFELEARAAGFEVPASAPGWAGTATATRTSPPRCPPRSCGSTPTARCACTASSSTCSSTSSACRPGSSGCPPSSSSRWNVTAQRCPRSTTATSGSTSTSPTGSSRATSWRAWTTPGPG